MVPTLALAPSSWYSVSGAAHGSGDGKAILFGCARTVYPFALSVGKALDIRRGTWCEPELALIPEFMKPGQTVVDIGANYGLWSYHFARAAGPSGHVVCFELIPATVRALRRVLWLLGVAARLDVAPAGAGEGNAPLRSRSQRMRWAFPSGVSPTPSRAKSDAARSRHCGSTNRSSCAK